jgi:acyl dehydratase
MKLYFEDLNEGTVFRDDECVADKDEMLDYARKNDPSPFHVDEEAARNSPYGGLIASAGYTVYGIGRAFLSSLQSRFLVGSNGISSCPYLCARATDCMPR